jgi:hypothetical protein
MGERDAFGREKGEDSLKQMGWIASGRAAWEPPAVEPGDPLAKPEPATDVFAAGEAVAPFSRKPRAALTEPEPSAAEALPAPEQPPRPTWTRRRRSRGPSLAKLIVLIAILGAGAIGLGKAADAGRNAVDGVRGQIDDTIHSITSPQPVSPSSSRSLLRAGPLKDALAKLPSGRLVSLRVAAERIDAQVIAGGKRHIVQVRADGSKTDVSVPAAPKEATLHVNSQAPMRIARTAARRSRLAVAKVDYLVLGGDGWLLFFKGGEPHYRASASGRNVTKS